MNSLHPEMLYPAHPGLQPGNLGGKVKSVDKNPSKETFTSRIKQ